MGEACAGDVGTPAKARHASDESTAANLAVTVDAEESERLDVMLDVFEAMGDAEPCAAGTGWAWRCKLIRSARFRRSPGWASWPCVKAAVFRSAL